MNEKLENFRSEAEQALRNYYALRAFRSLLKSKKSVRELNKNPEFWVIFESAILTKLFICIRRLFDSGRSSFNAQKFIEYAEQNIELFSLEKLRERKIAKNSDAAEWIDDYMIGKYEAKVEDIRNLSRLIRENSKKMKGIYTDVASKVYAHAVLIDHKDISELHSTLRFDEIEKSLLSVWHCYSQIWMMYENGRKPQLNVATYEHKDEVENAIKKQAGEI